MSRIGKNTRRRVLEETPDVCGLCGGGPRVNDPWTCDHVVPIALGGGNEFENLQKAHSFCNLLHGTYLNAFLLEQKARSLGYGPIAWDPTPYIAILGNVEEDACLSTGLLVESPTL